MGAVFHIYNRGVDKRTIFSKKDEYSYFVHLLYVLNDEKGANNSKRKLEKSIGKGSTSTSFRRDVYDNNEKREKLVDILAFTLMPNHYHLLVKEVYEDGIQRFMQKIGTGYTMFFNSKHDRSGSLFQGRYKRVEIESDTQMLYIPHYIHLNPLSLVDEKRENEKFDYLINYKWSSFPDYVGVKNFPSIISRKYILDLFGNE